MLQPTPVALLRYGCHELLRTIGEKVLREPKLPAEVVLYLQYENFIDCVLSNLKSTHFRDFLCYQLKVQTCPTAPWTWFRWLTLVLLFWPEQSVSFLL